MKRDTHRDPRPGLPTDEERRRTTERINPDTEHDTDRQARDDSKTGNASH
jgi:hypothetical protein